MTQPAASTTRLTIDRLRLRANGLDEGAARRLATLVGQGLAPSLQLTTGSMAIDALRIELPTQPGESPEALSRRIIDAIGKTLASDEVAP
ncbi:hypothetical protein MAUB1S_02894 [Mycolicibacterium aubagnense]